MLSGHNKRTILHMFSHYNHHLQHHQTPYLVVVEFVFLFIFSIQLLQTNHHHHHHHHRHRHLHYLFCLYSCWNVWIWSIYRWYPPGHGDIYASFYNSGLLQEFIKAGKKYMFISNIDNLGATVDISILGNKN